MTFNWVAGLVFFAALTATTAIGRSIAFRVPALQEMRERNLEADRPKKERQPYRDAIRINNRVGAIQALTFYAVVLPFFISFEALPWWRYIVDVVAVLFSLKIRSPTPFCWLRFTFSVSPRRTPTSVL